MGTNTDFTGAIRITPRVEQTLADRICQFLNIRHMRRDVAALHDLYPTIEARKPHSLFDDGDFGVDGALFIPTLTKDIDSAMQCSTDMPEGLIDQLSINQPPEPCPSLYCDLELVHDRVENCSYIGWNEQEKAYCISTWVEFFAEHLCDRGYHLDGQMFACVEGGMSFYQITVADRSVRVDHFVPETTYEHEFYHAKYDDKE